jgi:hypothetical protein
MLQITLINVFAFALENKNYHKIYSSHPVLYFLDALIQNLTV